MKPKDLMAYMATRGGFAYVKSVEGKAVAQSLRKQGLIMAVGAREGGIYYRFTPKGAAAARTPTKVRITQGVVKAAKVTQNYAQSFKEEPSPIAGLGTYPMGDSGLLSAPAKRKKLKGEDGLWL